MRTIAVARITMPKSVVRLSAGREDMSEETQALCFLAGANSIFYGPKLLTTPNPGRDRDMALLDKLGMHADGSDGQANWRIRRRARRTEPADRQQAPTAARRAPRAQAAPRSNSSAASSENAEKVV